MVFSALSPSVCCAPCLVRNGLIFLFAFSAVPPFCRKLTFHIDSVFVCFSFSYLSWFILIVVIGLVSISLLALQLLLKLLQVLPQEPRLQVILLSVPRRPVLSLWLWSPLQRKASFLTMNWEAHLFYIQPMFLLVEGRTDEMFFERKGIARQPQDEGWN